MNTHRYHLVDHWHNIPDECIGWLDQLVLRLEKNHLNQYRNTHEEFRSLWYSGQLWVSIFKNNKKECGFFKKSSINAKKYYSYLSLIKLALHAERDNGAIMFIKYGNSVVLLYIPFTILGCIVNAWLRATWSTNVTTVNRNIVSPSTVKLNLNEYFQWSFLLNIFMAKIVIIGDKRLDYLRKNVEVW